MGSLSFGYAPKFCWFHPSTPSEYLDMNSPSVSILSEIPEELHDTLKGYLSRHPDWDQDRVVTAALSLFLLQNGDTDRRAARIYLDSLFRRS